ncbi:hypothetical protein ILUMI_24157 [Ignelater luminosus]|uniref:RING-type domain-containing protein n=1 Tax=Ignelater luminosus TaxID=2038154 RepID=A0A8K0C7J7_IGNLU|nr:hypothetical protein ILUMI_24157 [Ignelater luminosus]
MMDLTKKPHEKIKLVEINPHLACYLCKGYYIDATTISECLHSFCRSCIIKFLHEHSYCPICEVIINKAKPNLKLDKTLQDIVYKLVPELFLNEMTRRQHVYQNHPELAAKVTPEERGEDIERTIFNPRDMISLSIEYISDDSTPGAILIPQLIGKGADINNRNKSQGADNEENSVIKRFLQCAGMCRVDVLKKFIRNKYNVDTNQYYIDILYKRVPLPDHYTLIDIAYIYSWKRNEPMKFFFKITDINLVTDSFDYLISPQLNQEKPLKTPDKKSPKKSKTETNKLKETNEDNKNNKDTNKSEVIKKDDRENNKKENNESIKKESNEIKKKETINGLSLKEESKHALEELRKNGKNQEYSNLTLDRSNNVEIITKIQKVSNKNGHPIGIKITKQTVKKPATSKLNSIKSSNNDKSPEPSKTPPASQVIPDIDPEKSNFLKSIELTAKTVLQAISPQKITLPPPKPTPTTGTKRKNPSPVKTDKSAKRPRKYVNIQPKAIQNPAVWQMVSNVNQNVTNMSKIVEQTTPTTTTTASSNSDLQALLFDSYKINIPASLSVTVKNEKDGPTQSPFQKPVQNYIEILKIPDTPTTASTTIKNGDFKENSKLKILDKLNTSVEVNTVEIKPDSKKEKADTKQSESSTATNDSIKQETSETKPPPTSKPPVNLQLPSTKCTPKQNPPQPKTPTCLPSPAYLPCKVTNMPTRDNFVKLNPRTPQTFQKMFEEAIKKPEFSSKFQTVPVSKSDNLPSPKSGQKNALNLTTNDTPTSGKRNILEIATKLYKKNKMEQDKINNESLEDTNSKSPSKLLNVPRVNPQKKPKYDKGNPPLKDFNTYISSKQSQPQTVTSLHSPTLGLNYTVSVTQTAPSTTPKTNLSALEIDTKSSSPKPSIASPRLPIVSPKPPQQSETTPLNIPRKYSLSPKSPKDLPVKSPKDSSKPSSSPIPKTDSPTSLKTASPTKSKTTSASENNQPLSPNQILEKYNIQNLAQLTANFNFPSNLCMNPANQLAAIHQAMIYRHFEMQNHQNWLNMNPAPLMQYEKYLQSLSKSS